jgi:hypothetical protein
MGFLKKVFKGIGKAVGSIAKGIVKFAKSPLGSLLINVGLSMITGGVGGLLAKGLTMLPKLAQAGNLLGTFAGVASKFLGPVQSFMSSSGLSTIAGFLGKAGNTGDLLSMATDLFKARQKAPPTDPTTDAVARENLARLFAQAQAQQLLRAQAA